MKILGFLAIFFVFLSIKAAAQPEGTSAHSLSLGASIGLLSGESLELVYKENSSHYLSQLTWQLQPLVLAGLNLRYDWRDSLFINAAFKYGIPGRTGSMEDRDWRLPQSDSMTHFSRHENDTDLAMLADLNTGKTFKLSNELRLKVFLSYRLIHCSFTAWGGTFQYPENEGGNFSLPGNDMIAKYKQTWHVLSPGISFYCPFGRFLGIEVLFDASPLALATTYDRHPLRGLRITNEALFPALYLEPSLLLSFRANSFLTLSLSADYRYLRGARGDSIYTVGGMFDEMYANSGGAGFSAFNIGLGARFKVR